MAGFQKAKRENLWVKCLNIGSSGSGKTYSNLRIATGLAQAMKDETGEDVRIAFIESESKRCTYYADEFDFDMLELRAPFTPETYIDAIDEAIDAGYKILILDSLTHEWAGKGGLLEVHSKMPGNSYTNWSKITPRHDAFMDKILDSPIHVFATVRGKDKYVLEEVNGKQMPRKIGLGYQQRDDIEFLFTVSLNVEQGTHFFSALKDNTHLFEDRNDLITEKDGKLLYQWANSGDITAKKKELEAVKDDAKMKIKLQEEQEASKITSEREEEVKQQKIKEKPPVEEVKEKITKKSLVTLKKEIIDTCKSLSISGKRETVVEIITKINNDPNPSNIKDLVIAEKVIAALEAIK